MQPTELPRPEEQFEPNLASVDFEVTESFVDINSSVSLAVAEVAPRSSATLSSDALAVTASATSSLLHPSSSFFGAAANGNCFCYVIDGSGSMRNGPWESAKYELLHSLSALSPKQRFYIIFYNRELSALPLPGEQTPAPSALYANPANLDHTRRWLDSLKIGIGGPPNDALDLAIAKEPDAIYLLTDGVTSVDVAQHLQKTNRVNDLIMGEQIRVAIHTIAFYSLDGQALLQQIAQENRGQFIYVPDPRKRPSKRTP